MSKKKGVSAEEKRTRMLQLFYEKNDFFQLKELEKIAPKEKGIIAQSVKDVVQSLVDDGLVDSEKIGTSIYFWAYSSKAKLTREKRLHDLNEKMLAFNNRLEATQEKLLNAKVGKEATGERLDLLQQVNDLKKEEKNLLDKINMYKDCDPEVLEQIKKDVEKSKEAANRWTDNIFAIKSWCKNKFAVEGNAMDKQFGIPSEMDYLE